MRRQRHFQGDAAHKGAENAFLYCPEHLRKVPIRIAPAIRSAILSGCDGFTFSINAEVNPIGDWSGGTDVDTGATNRKLGSDMADSVTGGGLHGKDLSKADVSVNIYAFLKAQQTNRDWIQESEILDALGDFRHPRIIPAGRKNDNQRCIYSPFKGV